MDKKIIIASIIVIFSIAGMLYLYMGGDNTNNNQNEGKPANIGIVKNEEKRN